MSLRAGLDAYLPSLDRLIHRGRELRLGVAADPTSGSILAAIRVWQRDCEDIVRQLSGGIKAHWVSRSYSQAFLIRSTGDALLEEARVAEIVERLVDVLEKVSATISQHGASNTMSAEAGPVAHRFDFVHNAALRPILERAYSDSRDALEQGRFGQSLLISCSILEAVITDALEVARDQTDRSWPDGGAPPEKPIADWSFQTRIAVAERAGLIRGGCARLPATARQYRDLIDVDGELRPDVKVSEREARLAGQVLHVVLRDRDPGRGS